MTRRASTMRAEDRLLTTAGLDLLASASRGTLLRVVGDGRAQFDRIASELSGYYLLGPRVAAWRQGRKTASRQRRCEPARPDGAFAPRAARAPRRHRAARVAAGCRRRGAQLALHSVVAATARRELLRARAGDVEGAGDHPRRRRHRLLGHAARLARVHHRRREDGASGGGRSARYAVVARDARRAFRAAIRDERQRGSGRLHAHARRRRRRSRRNGRASHSCRPCARRKCFSQRADGRGAASHDQSSAPVGRLQRGVRHPAGVHRSVRIRRRSRRP